MGIQRQSSGSSFGESSISGEYYVASADQDGIGVDQLRSMGMETGAAGVSFSSSKSWAQQTEESYQLQLSLALRLSSEATRADDPNFLDPVVDDSPAPRSASAEIMSHRFWVWLFVYCLDHVFLLLCGFLMHKARNVISLLDYILPEINIDIGT